VEHKKMNAAKRLGVVLLIVALALLALAITTVTRAQEDGWALCEKLAFSTEEDFMSLDLETYDGNPYISDGDLLSMEGLCLRNRELLRPLGVSETVDLGLDAVDVLDFDQRIIAFSTELDGPEFAAGDLLITGPSMSPIVIPNAALVDPFGIGYDVGLDGVDFEGGDLECFIKEASQYDRGGWLGGTLQDVLKGCGFNVWFSIEGTATASDGSLILDGDVLSVLGDIVTQLELLGSSFPADSRREGIDFGLDALDVPPDFAVDNYKEIRFSTEILYREGDTVLFTDGDVLMVDGAIEIINEDLVGRLRPKTFLGLDAYWLRHD
jgi:hypothetical protein